MGTAIDADRYAHIADEIFSPVYPAIASQILEAGGIREGLCIDIGAGTGMLGLAIADIAPRMEVVLYDCSVEMLAMANGRIGNRPNVHSCLGRAEALPFECHSADLIVSRGSVFFWEDQVAGMNEIYRALKPGGLAWIGGSFGSAAIFKEILTKMKAIDPDWDEQRKERLRLFDEEYFRNVMSSTIVPSYEIAKENPGIWVRFTKKRTAI